jgi:predicted MFS family arabinose efflux permease
MAVATGAIVANLYYLQPLLEQARRAFGVGETAASSLITLTQLGYAAGLALVVPLGDLVPRRRLVVAIFVISGAAMALAGLAPSFALFGAATLLAGLFSVGGQVMVPLAADLAPEERRGRVVARVMSGLLTGILLSRTVSGLVAHALGWRAVYFVAAGLMGVLAVALGRALPAEPVRPHLPYRALLADTAAMLVRHRPLRRRAWLGAASFACFSLLWTTLTFHLSAAPFHESQAVIGLWGLLGAAGVLAANAAGHLADRARQGLVTALAAALLVGSFVAMGIGGGSLVVLGVGVVLLDVGSQSMQITNQSIIFALDPARRSRINSAYMVCYFLGASAGSLLGGAAFQAGGWPLSCGLGVGLGLAALLPGLLWALADRRPSTSPGEGSG